MLARIRSRLFWWEPGPVVIPILVFLSCFLVIVHYAFAVVPILMIGLLAWIIADDSYEPEKNLDK